MGANGFHHDMDTDGRARGAETRSPGREAVTAARDDVKVVAAAGVAKAGEDFIATEWGRGASEKAKTKDREGSRDDAEDGP